MPGFLDWLYAIPPGSLPMQGVGEGMTFDTLKIELNKLENALAEARGVVAAGKLVVDAAATAREKAGNPRDMNHPAVLAHNKALSDYDKANGITSEIYGRYAKVRGLYMQYETQMNGVVSAPIATAKISPAPDAESIQARETAKLAEKNKPVEEEQPVEAA
jgi:hypothetical protein